VIKIRASTFGGAWVPPIWDKIWWRVLGCPSRYGDASQTPQDTVEGCHGLPNHVKYAWEILYAYKEPIKGKRSH
jgi:hypothetical protein